MKGISEEKVSSLVRGVKTRSSGVLKGVGEDFTPYGRTKPKAKPKEVTVKPKKYKKFDSLKLVRHMDTAENTTLKSYFGRTTDILIYLEYKQKEEESQMQDSQDIPKYSKSAFLQPKAFVHVESMNTDGIKKHVQEFILDISDVVFRLFIPIYTSSVSNWTLLHFNFYDHRWKYYNSLHNKSTSDACKSNAKMMINVCNYPIRRRNMFLQKKISEGMDPIDDTPFSEPNCVQQDNNNCLLFVCYFMKCIMRRQVQLPKSDVLQKIQNKRIKMAVKLCQIGITTMLLRYKYEISVLL
ncbi:hypothetical protein MKX01_004693 [Papaver californicum]|nr:hypothetical protein MKX01_004693 [Papaver californicum]